MYRKAEKRPICIGAAMHGCKPLEALGFSHGEPSRQLDLGVGYWTDRDDGERRSELLDDQVEQPARPVREPTKGPDAADIRVPTGELNPVERPAACEMLCEQHGIRRLVDRDDARAFGEQPTRLRI